MSKNISESPLKIRTFALAAPVLAKYFSDAAKTCGDPEIQKDLQRQAKYFSDAAKDCTDPEIQKDLQRQAKHFSDVAKDRADPQLQKDLQRLSGSFHSVKTIFKNEAKAAKKRSGEKGPPKTVKTPGGREEGGVMSAETLRWIETNNAIDSVLAIGKTLAGKPGFQEFGEGADVILKNARARVERKRRKIDIT